jgi:hypothetical protein
MAKPARVVGAARAAAWSSMCHDRDSDQSWPSVGIGGSAVTRLTARAEAVVM